MKYYINYQYDTNNEKPFGARATTYVDDKEGTVASERSGISYADAKRKLIETLKNIENMPVKEAISISKTDTSFENVFSKEEIYLIGKYLVENGLWYRDSDNGKPFSALSIRLPYDADLSSTGTRVNAINKLINS